VSIAHLQEVQEAIGKLIQEGQVDRRLSDKWHFYRERDKVPAEAKSIIIIAIPRAITRLTFSWQGRDYPAEVAPGYFYLEDEARAEETLRKVLEQAGFKMFRARLPLKSVAVRSGMARYGKNNLAYVPGMGSFHRLAAYYTDGNCEDNWRNPEAMPACTKCTLCRGTCANGSITEERFLIHAEKCLGNLRNIEPDVPHWVLRQPERANAFIGCMRCQAACPVNKPYIHNVIDGASFSEQETSMVLRGEPWDKLFPEMCRKLEDIRGIYSSLACDLLALIEKQKKAG
jgi:epoxyqueuosine reductase